MSRLADYINKSDKRLVLLVGGAGSGKTTFGNLVTGRDVIHVDDYFIGDSEFRVLLGKRKATNFESFIDFCNMYNWWDWEKLYLDVLSRKGKVLVEGAIIDDSRILSQANEIFLLTVPEDLRFFRLYSRDRKKRNFRDALERFLITEYSETIFYKKLLKQFLNKIVFVDENFDITTFPPQLPDTAILPFKVRI